MFPKQRQMYWDFAEDKNSWYPNRYYVFYDNHVLEVDYAGGQCLTILRLGNLIFVKIGIGLLKPQNQNAVMYRPSLSRTFYTSSS